MATPIPVEFNVDHILSMAHSPVRNYAIPGLTSYLLGAPGPSGATRLFVSEREHHEPIAPHSHRFAFRALVLRGFVRNIIWTPNTNELVADEFQATVLTYGGAPGRYTRETGARARWEPKQTRYLPGEWYGMKDDEVHSIFFSRGAVVLFFEGPPLGNSSVVLDPVVGGVPVPVSAVQPWMFQRDGKSGSDA